MTSRLPAATPCAACHSCDVDRDKRQSLQRLAGVTLPWLAGLPATAQSATDGPQSGDWLVGVDAEKLEPLRIDDLKQDAKQVMAWPHDPKAGQTRDGSRLNRVLLLRLDPASLDAETRARSVAGVVAYSGVCTHQACEVSSWRAQEKTLLCFCHFSQFQPAQGASVVAGPAPRSLPWLPLRGEEGRLIVAGPFGAPPGGQA